MRSTCRLTGFAKKTVERALREIGQACQEFQDKTLRNLRCDLLQCDEIWSFCGAKEKNATAEQKARGCGDIWTWVAIDAKTKLIPCWHVGNRDAWAAKWFMDDLASRLVHRIQLTTDGHQPYIQAVEDAFGCDIDYAMLVKLYGKPIEDLSRYSPPVCIGARKSRIAGNPDRKHVSTSFSERSNLTIRMHNRRCTRLTNAFSKKAENHALSMALHFMFYNFVRIHQTLRVTPAMEAGISDHVWTVEEVAALPFGDSK